MTPKFDHGPELKLWQVMLGGGIAAAGFWVLVNLLDALGRML